MCCTWTIGVLNKNSSCLLQVAYFVGSGATVISTVEMVIMHTDGTPKMLCIM
ncbi:hypothetical protein BDR04DRAFT_1143771, partial [Suillus decipiens]